MTRKGPLPNWLSPVAHVAAAAYGAAVRARANRFDASPPRARAGIAVISVGNVTVGGTGKTPIVRWCVETLQEDGRHPMVALRGYRSRKGLSDEAMEYEALLPGVRIAVGANRAASLARAVAEDSSIDCAVLDDAFQHRHLARDLDIVLVDATRPGLEGAMLPAGWLREPAAALRRADLVVVTRAAAVDPALAALVQAHHGRPPAAWCRHAWTWLDVFECTEGAAPRVVREPVSWLAERNVVAVAALAHPVPFVQGLHDAGARVVHHVLRHDHASYGAAEAQHCLALALADSSAIATTWKDWTKLRSALAAVPRMKPVTVAVPRVTIEFLQGEPDVRAAVCKAARDFQR